MEHIFTNEKIDRWLDDHLLFLGLGGCGKTHSIQQLIPYLLRQGKTITVIDFRHEYEEIAETNNGLSVEAGQLRTISADAPLVRIHFGDDIYYEEKKRHSIDFWDVLPANRDYLIIDDLHPIAHPSFFDKKDWTVAKVLEKVTKEHPNTLLYLASKGYYILQEEDKQWIQKHIPQHLLYRLYHADVNEENHFHRVLEMGECFLYEQEKAYYYDWRKSDFLE